VAAANRGAATLTATEAAIPSAVVVKFTDPTARVTGYQVLAGDATPVETGYATGGLPAAPAAPVANFKLNTTITDGQHLHIRVQAGNGTIWYHRIVVAVED
jgi:hypothetical protein